MLLVGLLAIGACDAQSSTVTPRDPKPTQANTAATITKPSSLTDVAPDPITKPPFPRPSLGDVDALVKGENAFAADLVRALSTQKGNVFVSPASVHAAIAMAYAGARGVTASEIASALHFDLPDAKLHPAYQTMLAELTKVDPHGPELRVADRLFGQDGLAFDPGFLALTRDRYGAPLAPVDFRLHGDDARKTINAWVEGQTNAKIKDLVPEGALTDDTRLVLANAIYFKGAWATPFDKSSTHDAPFTLADGSTPKVSTMHTEERLSYFDQGDAQLVELPFSSGDPARTFTMTIIVPKGANTLDAIEAKYDKLPTWLGSMSSKMVELSLPKFHVRSTFELTDALASLGMKSAFLKGVADFSGITKADHLFVSHVLHQAFVDVDENGAEAAAATAVMMDGDMAHVPTAPIAVHADRAFGVVIRDRRSGMILFTGRIADPRG